jgi:hypothetical protein
LRHHVVTLACVRQGLPSSYAEGADNLPQEQQERILAGLVDHLDVEELERAFAVVYSAFTVELALSAPDLAVHLQPILDSFAPFEKVISFGYHPTRHCGTRRSYECFGAGQ